MASEQLPALLPIPSRNSGVSIAGSQKVVYYEISDVTTQSLAGRNVEEKHSRDTTLSSGRDFLMSGVERQITNSWATPRTSISKSRPCTGGRAKCHVKPPGLAPRRMISSARSGWISKIV